jgi:two-component system LytT family response regulator
VIFVTAFDRYAVRAFEVNALDYLLKPLEPERLAGAIGRARRDGGSPGTAKPFLRTDRVFLDTGRQALFLDVAEIAAIRAAGNYSEVIDAKGRAYTVRVPLSDWEERLPRNLFILLDRSLLVNQDRIRRCVRHRRRADLYLADLVHPIPLGRAAFRRFRECIAVHAAGTASP